MEEELQEVGGEQLDELLPPYLQDLQDFV